MLSEGRRRRVEGSSDQLHEVRHIVPSDNAVSNGGYYITQQQLQLERAREVEQRLMTELQQLTREKEQVTREKEQVTREKEQVTREKEQVTREKEQVTREKEQVCSSLAAVPYMCFMIITTKAIVSLTWLVAACVNTIE